MADIATLAFLAMQSRTRDGVLLDELSDDGVYRAMRSASYWGCCCAPRPPSWTRPHARSRIWQATPRPRSPVHAGIVEQLAELVVNVGESEAFAAFVAKLSKPSRSVFDEGFA